jgi:hypothetical protein
MFLAFAFAGTVALAQQPIASRTAPLGAVDGFVSDTSLAPLGDATISIVGSNIQVVTGANGRFRMESLTPGTYMVLARRLGFEPAFVSVRVSEGDTLRMSILLDRAGTALDTVHVVGSKSVLARHQEFESRRLNHVATASFTEEDIEKRNLTQTWQMLTVVPSINVTDRQEDGHSVVVATARRAMITSLIGPKGNQPCFLKVMVDGVPVAADDAQGRPNLSYLPPPSSIHGIEVFAGPASIPLQYSGAGDAKWCGLIAIWTK